ncbi:WD repeat protein iqw1 [Sphaceloma murrayae]|uniref:WD repeat protein iqw1 n=1 Tax=Sphaceloma murrayae TaxID=2082308 RepID=A0A2K1QG58_9PEZI|nr:WD repeat protein iqw1 [Sphaceloma murrayae]
MSTTVSYPGHFPDFGGVQKWSQRSLHHLLHDRELRDYTKRTRKVRSAYGRPEWVENLDIVNELGGHSGCVNALSWSKSGRLLASGSDDKHLNIQKYQPEDSNAQFSLATTVATGHTANIFSVKFMPHSNDQTVITCAGDGEVRIFDLESSSAGMPSTAADMASHARLRGHGLVRDGVRYLSDGNTDCRVYRSHGDRVKRIVTESSPYLFLSCSEDGEVRQWDLRLPSSAYPRPRRGDDSSVPPPLISYKRFQIDLHTISCSPSQPYYIALGGSHLHCFLHDRRMMGRDKGLEAGRTNEPPWSDDGSDLMGQATQCVRRFAPSGQGKMGRSDNGHITACKISDAHPNELIASWSGEHIYSFDIVRSPDAAAQSQSKSGVAVEQRRHSSLRQSSELKRKRNASSENALSQQGGERAESRPRTESPISDAHEMALRVQYGNGQSEDIPVREQQDGSTPRTPQQRSADDIARRAVKLSAVLLDTRTSTRPPSQKDPTGFASSFTSVLGYCASTLPQMKEVHGAWRYPVDTSLPTVVIHRTLRANRESAIRFVQAAGVTARVLGGRLQSASAVNPAMGLFEQVHVSTTDGPQFEVAEQFRYDFLRAIFLWLDSGIGALIQGFSKETAPSARVARRFPIPSDADMEAIDEFLIPYLLGIASEKPVVNIDVSRFEVDENRIVFQSEQQAVREFAEAIKKPFADLSADFNGHDPDTQQRYMAIRFWGMTVARGILRNAWEELDFSRISRAFGGLGSPDAATARQEDTARERNGDIDTSVEEDNVASASVQLVSAGEDRDAQTDEEPIAVSDIIDAFHEYHAAENGDMHSEDDDASTTSDSDGGEVEDGAEDVEEDDGEGDSQEAGSYVAGVESSEGEGHDSDDSEDDDNDDDDDEGYQYGFPGRLRQSAVDRRKLWASVEADVPCIPHTRSYQGHCNVKTVKDVNFYGLDDEYVVSGSDDGNLFIWDRKTSKLITILEGDGEVVNVIQGHPYEPLLAVSGIDDTIKIFSPDARARMAARLGSGVEAADSSTFSSISWPSRARGRRVPRRGTNVTSEPATEADNPALQASATLAPEEDEDFVADSGLTSRKRIDQAYQIMNENDQARQGGNQEAYITASDLLALLLRNIR